MPPGCGKPRDQIRPTSAGQTSPTDIHTERHSTDTVFCTAETVYCPLALCRIRVIDHLASFRWLRCHRQLLLAPGAPPPSLESDTASCRTFPLVLLLPSPVPLLLTVLPPPPPPLFRPRPTAPRPVAPTTGSGLYPCVCLLSDTPQRARVLECGMKDRISLKLLPY